MRNKRLMTKRQMMLRKGLSLVALSNSELPNPISHMKLGLRFYPIQTVLLTKNSF